MYAGVGLAPERNVVGCSRTIGLTVCAIGLAIAVTSAGCTAGADGGDESSDGAFTVERGHRFVVSAEPTRVVLAKRVGGHPFPFGAHDLLGKAILIHPALGKSEAGVYARVMTVEDSGMQLRLDTIPLTLEEMAAAREDEIVRIYMSPDLPATPDPPLLDTRPQVPLPAGLGVGRGFLGPRAWNGLLAGQLPVMGEIQLVPGLNAEANVNVSYRHGQLSLVPGARAAYTPRGLDLGFRTDFLYDGAIDIHADTNVRAKLFRTERVHSPPAFFALFVGPVPVPVRVRLGAFLECEALGKTKLDATITMHAAAHLSMGLRIKPSPLPLPTWVGAGEWPNEIGGEISSRVDGDMKLGLGSGLECTLPRVELETMIAGVAGPYLAVCPEAAHTRNEGLVMKTSASVTLKAGLRGQLFGREANAELDVLGWSPR